MNNATNNQPTPAQIAARAYQIWEKEGAPDGRHETHWLEAEKQLIADRAQETGVLSHPALTAPAEPAAVERLRSVRRNQSKHTKSIAQ